MTGKITIEEHFGIEETLRESAEYAVPGQLNVLERRLLDLDDERLREMDAHGIAFAILSLNAPGVQSVHERRHAPSTSRGAATTRWRPESPGTRIGTPDLRRCRCRIPMRPARSLTRAVKELGFKGAMVNGFSQIGDADTIVYYDDPCYRPFWATLAELERAVLPAPARSAAEPRADLRRPPVAARRVVGVRRRDGDARAASDGERHLRHAPGLTAILGHLGEMLPYCIWRFDHRVTKRPRGIPARKTFTEYLRSNFYVTTSGNFHTNTLKSGDRGIGRRSRAVLGGLSVRGSARRGDVVRRLRDSEADRLKIGRTNATQLFNLK